MLQILNVSDSFNSPIILNSQLVFTVNPTTLQIVKELRHKYPDRKNTLYVIYKKFPNLNEDKGDANNQNVDIPKILLECVILGMAKFAHSTGLLTTDTRVGGSYIVNPYLERYELAIKKAFEYGFIQDSDLLTRDIRSKGFL